MTAISPLASIHKKGLFGDHQKKDETELLQISEVKNLVIVQLLQYKKSKIELKNIKINNLELPKENSLVVANKDTRILWSSPKTWLIISYKQNIFEEVNKNCSVDNFAVTDISHSRAVIKIKGTKVREVLKKGCPLNINEIKKNHCAGTVFNGIAIIIDCFDEEPDTFNLLSLRSFGESFYHHITDASLEFGYIGE
jgi:heterotetrameric sarcosine oxidase gamma subunit